MVCMNVCVFLLNLVWETPKKTGVFSIYRKCVEISTCLPGHSDNQDNVTTEISATRSISNIKTKLILFGKLQQTVSHNLNPPC